jgi:hypothetical protein
MRAARPNRCCRHRRDGSSALGIGVADHVLILERPTFCDQSRSVFRDFWRDRRRRPSAEALKLTAQDLLKPKLWTKLSRSRRRCAPGLIQLLLRILTRAAPCSPADFSGSVADLLAGDIKIRRLVCSQAVRRFPAALMMFTWGKSVGVWQLQSLPCYLGPPCVGVPFRSRYVRIR